MTPVPFMILAMAALSPDAAALAEPPAPRVGDTHKITLVQDWSSATGEGLESSSHSGHAILERVTGVRADGIELEYRVPETDPAESTASNWQFPARIFRPHSGPPVLLNGAELEARLEAWLKKAKWTREVCGRWIFTWTAIRIECDPQSAIGIVQAYDLGPADLREGIPYRTAEALGPAPVTKKASGPEGSTFAVELEVDPEAIRRGRIETDVAVGEMSGTPVTLETAIRNWAKSAIAGTISVTFETDPAGRTRRRTEVMKLEIRNPAGEVEKSIATATVERSRSTAPTRPF